MHGQNHIKFDILVFFENVSRKFKFRYNRTRITGTLFEDLYTFLIISRCTVGSFRDVSDKICKENQNTLFMLNASFSKIVSFMS